MRVIKYLAKNQAVLGNDNTQIFQSYDSVIALWKNGKKPILSEHWDYSKTTMKYLGKFLDSNSKEIRDKVKSGEYKIGIDTKGNLI